MRIKIIVSYDGSKFCGFQRQKNAINIQKSIENALSKIYNTEVFIKGAGRTDAGVHAKGQVFHFDSDKKKDLGKLKYSFNSLLPKDIHVLKVENVSDNFHARFSVKNKTYEYIINTGEYDVFSKSYAYQCFYHLDIELMKKGAALLIGEHDFSSFNTSSEKEYPNQVRTISEFKITTKKDKIIIRVTSTGFLRNMVRIMVGTLIDLGRGQKTLKDIKDMLDHPCKSTRRFNADPHGLYLIKIRY